MDYTILFKIIFSTIVLLSCFIIYKKTNKFYRLSFHRGIKYFRNSFIFFTIAFISNIIIVVLNKYYSENVLMIIPSFLVFNFTLCMGGFFLVYSLLWKDSDKGWDYFLIVVALVLSIVDFFYVKGLIYGAHLFTLGYGMFVSYSNYKLLKTNNFRQLLFISIVLAFIGYAVNLSGVFLIQVFPLFWLYSYIITASAFVLIAFLVVRS